MVFCGLFRERKSSSKKNRTNGLPAKAIQSGMLSKYSADLRSYIGACNEDSNLRSFDLGLHQQTNKVISSLADRAKTQSLSLDSLMEVYGFLLEVNRDAVNIIIESREDVWKNKDLKSLIDVYFQSTENTLEFCNTVENCVKKTENGQLIIRFAVKQFETESVNKKKKTYAKTLEELNKFKAIGDPFGDDFMTQYYSVHEQQILLLEELRKLKVKLDKKQRNVETWKRLWNVIFATALVSALVVSVVLAAMIIPPVLSAVASALTAPMEDDPLFYHPALLVIRNWFSKMLEEYEKAVKTQKGLVSLVEDGATVNHEATKTIRILVDNLRIRISSILQAVDFSLEREDEEVATRLAMQEIRKKVEEFTELIERVGDSTDKCSKIIVSGRLQVLEFKSF